MLLLLLLTVVSTPPLFTQTSSSPPRGASSGLLLGTLSVHGVSCQLTTATLLLLSLLRRQQLVARLVLMRMHLRCAVKLLLVLLARCTDLATTTPLGH